MGMFRKTSLQQQQQPQPQSWFGSEDPATIAVTGDSVETTLPPPKQQQQQQQESSATATATATATTPAVSLKQWKKTRRAERESRKTLLQAKQQQRSARIDRLVVHRSANRATGPQNEYCTSPTISAATRNQTARTAAAVGWGTAKMAVKGMWKKGKKSVFSVTNTAKRSGSSGNKRSTTASEYTDDADDESLYTVEYGVAITYETRNPPQ